MWGQEQATKSTRAGGRSLKGGLDLGRVSYPLTVHLPPSFFGNVLSRPATPAFYGEVRGIMILAQLSEMPGRLGIAVVGRCDFSLVLIL